jgi:CrcB protein
MRGDARVRSIFMFSYFLVAVGGALGSIARFWISGLVAERAGQTFPFGTLVVNVTGSFIIGLFAAFSLPEGRSLLGPFTRQFFMIGVCGGYTTFSSFSLQTLALAQEGEWMRAILNSLASVVFCVAAVWLGFAGANFFNKP